MGANLHGRPDSHVQTLGRAEPERLERVLELSSPAGHLPDQVLHRLHPVLPLRPAPALELQQALSRPQPEVARFRIRARRAAVLMRRSRWDVVVDAVHDALLLLGECATDVLALELHDHLRLAVDVHGHLLPVQSAFAAAFEQRPFRAPDVQAVAPSLRLVKCHGGSAPRLPLRSVPQRRGSPEGHGRGSGEGQEIAGALHVDGGLHGKGHVVVVGAHELGDLEAVRHLQLCHGGKCGL